MRILDTLTPELIKVPLESTEKRAVINELVDLLAEHGRVHDVDTLRDVIWKREQQRSTGIGEGLAIPHGKSDCTDELAIAIGRPAEPLEFDAIDKKPVQLIFLLVSPPHRTSDHIQALGKISRLMSQPEFRRAIYDAQTAEQVYQLLEEAERPQPQQT